MQLSRKIKINPSEQQKKVLWILSEKCRLIYNFALKERIYAFQKGVEKINYYKQQNDLPLLKEQYPEYKWVYSKVLQMVLRQLDTDFKSFYSLWNKGYKDANPPRFKGKKHFTTMTYNQSEFKHYDNKIRLSHRINKTLLEFNIPNKFKFNKIYQISVFMKNGDFYLSVLFEQTEKTYMDNGLYQAFDLGALKHTAVNNKGRFIEFENKRPDKYWSKSIKELQSRRDHCKKGSKRWRKFHRNFCRCKRKSSNQFLDFQHKLSRKIVDNTKANTIIIGNLSIKELCSLNKYQKELHLSLHNTDNIGRFVRFLTYKTKLVGKRIIEINERGTSKTCCCCGKEHNMPLCKRVMNCDCGNNMDRDMNSSINIMIRYLSQNGLWTAYQQFVGNLRQTGISLMEMYS